MDRMRVCLTGFDGFIGKNLTEYAESFGGIEFVPYSPASLPAQTAGKLGLKPDGFLDLLIPEHVEAFFGECGKFDALVHLAGQFFGDYAALVRTNLETLQSALQSCAKYNIPKVVFSSTGAVYGEPAGEESFESDPRLPNTDYGLVKLYCEETLEYFERSFGVAAVILRFPNVYGKGNNKGVVYNFIDRIETKGEISLNGDGTQSRNFLHVRDACQGICKALVSAKSGAYNISNPRAVTLNELIDLLAKDYKFTVTRTRDDSNKLQRLLLNIDKARKEFGFEPEVTDVILEK